LSKRTGKPHKIAFCEGNLDGTIGGSYFSLLYLVSGLDRTEFEPVVVFRREHDFLMKYRDAGVPTLVFPTAIRTHAPGARNTSNRRKVLGTMAKKYRSAISFFRLFVIEAVRVTWWLFRNRIRLVHLNNSVTRLHSWMFAARLLRIPCISHERGLNTQYSKMTRYFAPRLDRVICISQAVQDNLKAHGVTSNNTVVIYNGLDSATFRPSRGAREIREDLGIDEAVPVIGMIGNLREWKGQDVVIRAMGCLLRDYPGLMCVFVGSESDSDHPFRRKLVHLAADLGVSGNIVFTGYRDDVANLMNAMDIVIHASVDPEPFGRVLIEAMALGKPLIGARAGAVPEIIAEPISGLMFLPGDHHDLCQAVSTLLANEKKRVAMGDAARRRVQDKFGIWRNVHETQMVYREILGT
jgi:glycosyltransferase involved in cell wall biosynthesis